MKVLVVDDYIDLALHVATLLIDAGHDAEVAYDGSAGLRKFRDGNFDAVISDWNMPNLNGFLMVSAILETHPTVKVIMMSGDYSNQPPERADGRKIKMFQKPFHKDALLEELVK